MPRPAIGYISNNPLWDDYYRGLWEGVVAGAETCDVHLVCFSATSVDAFPRYVPQNLTVFSQITPANIDGIIAAHLFEKSFQDAVPAFNSLPVVTIQTSKFASVSLDNRLGSRIAIEHLIKAHGRQRIAFIRGTAGETSGEDRYQSYLDVLRANGLPHDPSLVFQGDYWPRSGEQAIRAFIDERHVSFDAVVAANDWMAIAALDALHKRGYAVPERVSVIGFDDTRGAKYSNPPLTTIRQPLKDLGASAVQILVRALTTKTAPQSEILTPELVVRRSCGCMPKTVVSAGALGHVHKSWRSRFRQEPLLTEYREVVIADAVTHLGNAIGQVENDWAAVLLDSLAFDLAVDSGQSLRKFLGAMDHLIARFTVPGQPAAMAHEPLSAFRTACLPHIVDSSQREKAESLWQQARILIQEASDRQVAQKEEIQQSRDKALRYLVRSLAGIRQLSALSKNVMEWLEGLGIRSAFLAIHESPTHPVESSRIIMAYRDGRPLVLPKHGITFPTRQIIPADFAPSRNRRHSLMITPIFLDFDANDQIGFAVFEIDGQNGRTCAFLAEQLGSPMRSALVYEEISQEMATRRQSEEELASALTVFLDVVSFAAQGDLTRRGTEGADTLGKIATSVNAMLRRFASILSGVRAAANSLSISSGAILGSATEIANGAEKNSDQVNTTTSAVTEMATSMTEVSRNADASAVRVHQVLEHVNRSDASVQAAHVAMTKIHRAVIETAEKMRLLEQRSLEVSDVVGLIDDIAKRSKLLALNASITAAQAGDAGRAFAVVAEEVARLADNSLKAAGDVAERINRIVHDTRPAILAMDKAMDAVKEGREVSEQARASLQQISILAQESTRISSSIATASREQAQATKGVATSMQSISEIGAQSAISAKEASASVRELVALAKQLEQEVSRFKI